MGKSKLLDFSTMPTITESHAYIYPILLYQAQKSIPCLGNKYYNKAIDNRNLEVANMSGCLRLRNI